MQFLTRSRAAFALRTISVILFLVMGLMSVLGLALTQQVDAGFNCDGNSWNVSNEDELNGAIDCYNSKTIKDDYNINFTQNINLITQTNSINNKVEGVALTIEGNNHTLDGQGNQGVRPFTIYLSTTVTLQNITITGGRPPDSGNRTGGIYNSGNLTINSSRLISNIGFGTGGLYNYRGNVIINNSTISDNSTTYHGSVGGGILNYLGFVTLNNSTVSNNSAGTGGGLFNHSGHFTVNGTTLSNNNAGNDAGAIFNQDGTFIIHNSTLQNNEAGGEGGGLENKAGLFIVNNSSIINNSAVWGGGGISNEAGGGTVNINNSSIISNSTTSGQGGAIYNESGSTTVNVNNCTLDSNTSIFGGGIHSWGIVTVTQSTISNNHAEYGGGINSMEGTLAVINSTVSRNRAEYSGGGIRGSGTITIDSSTLSGNEAFGVGDSLENSGNLSISNSIVANGGYVNDCSNSGTINDLGHNLIEFSSYRCGFTGDGDPLLSPLQNNGGATFTHALLPGSPAIDAGDTTLTSDQRGYPRPQGLANDIGAYEAFESSDFVYLPMIQK